MIKTEYNTNILIIFAMKILSLNSIDETDVTSHKLKKKKKKGYVRNKILVKF